MTQAMSNYIYYKNQDWQQNKSALRSNFDMNITAAYLENAAKLEANLALNDLPDDFVEQVQEALDFRTTAVSEVNQDLNQNFFQEIQNFVSGELSSYILASGGLTVGNANVKLKKTILSIKQLNEVLKNFQKIIDKIDEFDEGFKTLGNADISFLDAAGMNKTKVAYDSVKSFIQQYSGTQDMSGLEGINKEITRIIGLVTGDLKGGLYEYADYIHTVAVSTAIEETEKQVKILGGRMTGTESNYIPSEQLRSALGQDTFVAKSDNIVTVMTYNSDGVEVQIDLGISDKSYKSSKASGKSIATGVNWQALMYEANLTETAFEYYYANLMVHERNALSNHANEYNRYLAAKASAFLISGVSGGSITQAYFVRYGNTIMYVPNVLRRIAGKGSGFFKLTPQGSVENTFVETPEDQTVDSYIRTKNTMSSLRQSITFNARR